MKFVKTNLSSRGGRGYGSGYKAEFNGYIRVADALGA